MIPAGLMDNRGEIFAYADTAMITRGGKISDVKDSIDLLTAFREELENDPRALKAIEARTSDPVKQIIEYIRCTRGDFDMVADIDTDGVIVNQHEYWNCGKRGQCADEGLVCKLPSQLTIREVEIVKLIASDKADKEIACSLEISIATVHTHRVHIERKLGVSSKAGVASFAISHNIK